MSWLLGVSFCLSLSTQEATANSCRPYVKSLKKYSIMYNSPVPYYYLVAQDKVESNCRFVTSYDGVGSESPAQITWKIWGRFLKPYGIYNLKTIKNFTKAQVIIMKSLYKHSVRKGYTKGWLAFQEYNGGGLVYREAKRANSSIHSSVRRVCHRRVIRFKNGSRRSACNINYNYPIEIYSNLFLYYSDLIDEKTEFRLW